MRAYHGHGHAGGMYLLQCVSWRLVVALPSCVSSQSQRKRWRWLQSEKFLDPGARCPSWSHHPTHHQHGISCKSTKSKGRRWALRSTSLRNSTRRWSLPRCIDWWLGRRAHQREFDEWWIVIRMTWWMASDTFSSTSVSRDFASFNCCSMLQPSVPRSFSVASLNTTMVHPRTSSMIRCYVQQEQQEEVKSCPHQPRCSARSKPLFCFWWRSLRVHKLLLRAKVWHYSLLFHMPNHFVPDCAVAPTNSASSFPEVL